MVLTWTTTQYPIKISSILRILNTKFLIPPTDAELMDRNRRTREGYAYICLRDFPKENLAPTHFMLSTWWFHLLERIGHYVIHPGEIEQVLVMTNNIATLGYTYAKRRLNNPSDIFYKLSHTVQLIVWIPSRLAWTLALRGRDRSLLSPRITTAFYGTNNQEGSTNFDTFMRYMIWE